MGCSSVAISLLLAFLGPAVTALEPADGQSGMAGELALDSSRDTECYQGACRQSADWRQHASTTGEQPWMASYRQSLWAGWDAAPDADQNGAETACEATAELSEETDGEYAYTNNDAYSNDINYSNDVNEQDEVAYDEYQDGWMIAEEPYDGAEDTLTDADPDNDPAAGFAQPLVWVRDPSGYWTIADDRETGDADSYEAEYDATDGGYADGGYADEGYAYDAYSYDTEVDEGYDPYAADSYEAKYGATDKDYADEDYAYDAYSYDTEVDEGYDPYAEESWQDSYDSEGSAYDSYESKYRAYESEEDAYDEYDEYNSEAVTEDVTEQFTEDVAGGQYDVQYGATAGGAVLDTIVLWMSGSLDRVGDAFHGLARRVSGLRGESLTVGSRTDRTVN